MTVKMRPGIYTDYTLTPLFSGKRGRAVGIAAQTTADCEGVQTVESLSQAKRIFGEESPENVMMQLIAAVYACASPVLYAVGLRQDTDAAYQEAVDQLCATPASILTLDRRSLPLYQYLKGRLETAGEKLGEVSGIPEKEAAETAAELNCERLCLAVPETRAGGMTADLSAAALAALISGCDAPQNSLNGTALPAAFSVTEHFSEEEMEAMMEAGVCVFEERGGAATLIRGLTTRTRDAQGEADGALRNLGVILTVDTVIPALRELLQDRLETLGGDQTGLNAILSLVVSRLDDFVDLGLISSYETPAVFLEESDPSVCIVEVGFTVAQGLASIYLTAHITV